MKALVLCGGKGTRLYPLTKITTKQLLPIGGKPIIYYTLEWISQTVSDVGIVISAQFGEQVKEVVGDGSQWNIQTTYIVQDYPMGTAHAVKISRHFLENDDFLMVLGDNIFSKNTRYFVEDYLGQDAYLLVKEVNKPEEYGIVELDEKQVISVEEKPIIPRSNLALTGAYIFSLRIHEAIDLITPSAKGEIDIADAIQRLVDDGHIVEGCIMEDDWVDTGTIEGLAKATELVERGMLL